MSAGPSRFGGKVMSHEYRIIFFRTLKPYLSVNSLGTTFRSGIEGSLYFGSQCNPILLACCDGWAYTTYLLHYGLH